MTTDPSAQSNQRSTFNSTSLPTSPNSDTNTAPSTVEKEAAPFNWHEQWYPVGLIADLDATKPTAVTILGQRLVLWRSSLSNWSVFRDACPHRLAPLSEGRICEKSGELQCSYHGWQFDGGGRCSAIPQAADATLAASHLACASALPTQTECGIVFAWLGAREPRADERPAVVEGPRAAHVASSFSRVLPFSSWTLLENVLDPAHIFFAHHGQLATRDKAGAIDIRMVDVQDRSVAFAGDYYDGQVLCQFRPPCLVQIQNAAGEAYAYYAIPTADGMSMTIGVSCQARRPGLLQRLVPRWVDHLRRNALVDGDLPILYAQESRVSDAVRERGGLQAQYYLPTECDRLIIHMRRWASRNPAPVGNFGSASTSTTGSSSYGKTRKEMLDRLSAHTESCSVCSAALRNTQRLRALASVCFWLAVGMAGFSSVATSGATTRTSLPRQVISRVTGPRAYVAYLALALILGIARAALTRLAQLFIYDGDRVAKITRGP